MFLLHHLTLNGIHGDHPLSPLSIVELFDLYRYIGGLQLVHIIIFFICILLQNETITGRNYLQPKEHLHCHAVHLLFFLRTNNHLHELTLDNFCAKLDCDDDKMLKAVGNSEFGSMKFLLIKLLNALVLKFQGGCRREQKWEPTCKKEEKKSSEQFVW